MDRNDSTNITSPTSDQEPQRGARQRTYTTLRHTTPPENVFQKFQQENGINEEEPEAPEGSYPIGKIAGGLEELKYGEIFKQCATTGRRPAERVFVKSWKSFTTAAAEEHYKQNPDDYIALCADISDYEECFYNYKDGAYCGADEVEQFDHILEQVFCTLGSFLDEPVKEKHTATVTLGDGTVVATTSMQGWRTANEDAHVIHGNLCGEASYACTAILDGHGGTRVAQFCSKVLVEHLEAAIKAQGAVHPVQEATVAKAVENLDEAVENDMKEEHRGSVGTTLNLLVYTGKEYVCGNSGDSRAILCRTGGEVHPLSDDHKPDNPGEQARIEAAGGRVQEGRVEGILAVSRALGDYDFKQAGSLPPSQQAVSCTPDVTTTPTAANDHFIVQACDGIWDCKTNEEVYEFVATRLAAGMPPGTIIEQLCDACLATEVTDSGLGTDNMSVNLLVLKK
eukprot:TRINITY_DN739_c0_g1_i1.p1 TRINITY_DN739_c0_g1~~TRINITY_DN739_c0_g1_i1.p1  ORF type:complete len:453 (+),score=146.41 TRINITY_DN739_c0_g1_i1:173-1531(+)